MTNRYRGTLYVGVTAQIAARVLQHREGTGSAFCRRENLTRLVWAEHGDTIEGCIAHEKRLKHWHRNWKNRAYRKREPGLA